ncbi:hypothetical protein BGX28_004543 [Mortierella sp. GBA30]|nr:hypothetical protein BGX28_004543 [Mortierella sp. GBA30]
MADNDHPRRPGRPRKAPNPLNTLIPFKRPVGRPRKVQPSIGLDSIPAIDTSNNYNNNSSSSGSKRHGNYDSAFSTITPPRSSTSQRLVQLPGHQQVGPKAHDPMLGLLAARKQQSSGSTRVDPSKIFVDDQDQPLKICIARTVRDIDHLKTLIKAHGGETTNDEKAAFIRLADPGRSYEETMYSTAWVRDCIHEQRRLNNYTPVYRLKTGARSSREPFTLADDRLLKEYVRAKKAEGAKLNGNLIYEEFAAMHNHHTAQSWRERAVKDLKLTMPPSPYELSKAKREEAMKKQEEQRREGPARQEQPSADRTVSPAITNDIPPLPQTRRTSDTTAPRSSGNDVVVVEREVVENATLKYQTQPADQSDPEFLSFSDIESDEEEDNFHRSQLSQISQRSSNDTSNTAKAPSYVSGAKETPWKNERKRIPEFSFAQEEVVPPWELKKQGFRSQSQAVDIINDAQKRMDVESPRASAEGLRADERPAQTRHISLSPARITNKESGSGRMDTRHTRRSLPNMSSTKHALRSSNNDAPVAALLASEQSIKTERHWESLRTTPPQAIDLSATEYSNPPSPMEPVVESFSVDYHMMPEAQTAQSSSPREPLRSLSPPAPSEIMESVSDVEPHPKLSTLPVWRNSPQANLTLPDSFSPPIETSAIGDKVELTEEDDIIVEQMILQKNQPSLSMETPEQTAGTEADDIMEMDGRAETHEFRSQSTQFSKGSIGDDVTHKRTRSSSGEPVEKGRDEAQEQSQVRYKGFELPDKLLMARPPRQRSRGQSEKAKKGDHSKDGSRSSEEAAQRVQDGASPQVLERLEGSQEAGQHEDDNLEVAPQKVSADDKVVKREQEETGNRVQDESSTGNIPDPETVHGHLKEQGLQHEPEPMSQDEQRGHEEVISQEEGREEEDEERLVRRRPLPVRARPVDKKPKTVLKQPELLETPSQPASPTIRNAVQEFYGPYLGESYSSEVSKERYGHRTEQLLHYLREKYKTEIQTLMQRELVPPKNGIELLDSCSGDLELALRLVRKGMTEDIESRFWTREDDCLVFSEKSEVVGELMVKHTPVELVQRVGYLIRTRSAAEKFVAPPTALPSTGMLKRRPVPESDLDVKRQRIDP